MQAVEREIGFVDMAGRSTGIRERTLSEISGLEGRKAAQRLKLTERLGALPRPVSMGSYKKKSAFQIIERLISVLKSF